MHSALNELAAEYWEGVLRRNPVLATFFGDFRYNDRLADISEMWLRWMWSRARVRLLGR